ncbi:50S ribosomal protein L30 (plasmid) [Legionella adelaidensis]|uniref:Large ribosomal subunit protein uL30 n=1 Tax=Legionella adelaidensis TaxID=45056 RepID=A0A0W0R2E6_9GAMM|nr:50S ribosomal protein L30 [Legionella adelaidensis]KTC65224.1 50S ribosomal protein L30 [Legionella adelaidensis]VEH82895.1 50S ribosomal protein L30 [Legionella adelaidensis]
MTKKIKITLVKSLIGRIPKHITIAKQLGLGKMNSSVVHNDIPAIRGMVNSIHYLLKVEECSK